MSTPTTWDDPIADAIAIRESAPCSDCLDAACDAAAENLADRGEATDRVAVLREAREYLFDRGALSGCTAHEGLL